MSTHLKQKKKKYKTTDSTVLCKIYIFFCFYISTDIPDFSLYVYSMGHERKGGRVYQCSGHHPPVL